MIRQYFKNTLVTSVAVIVYSAVTILLIYYNQNKLNELESKQAEFISRKESAVQAVNDQVQNNSGKVNELIKENEKLMVDVTELKKNLSVVQGELDTILRPLKSDVLSSTLKTKVGKGEVLVTGGSLTPDGNYQYAFVEPVTETLADGKVVVHLNMKQLSIESQTIPKLGLDGLKTNAGNTLQHGEVWGAGEVENINQMLGRGDGVSLLTSPQITVVPGEKTKIKIGDIQIDAKADILPDGSFDIEIRSEQNRFSESLFNTSQ